MMRSRLPFDGSGLTLEEEELAMEEAEALYFSEEDEEGGKLTKAQQAQQIKAMKEMKAQQDEQIAKAQRLARIEAARVKGNEL